MNKRFLRKSQNKFPESIFIMRNLKRQKTVKGKEAKALQPTNNRKTYIGRNDKCYCGSGKKYKKCCLGKEGDANSDAKAKAKSNKTITSDLPKEKRSSI